MKGIRARAGTNIGGAGAHNRRVVMQALRMNGVLSRAEIARATGLVPQTVSNIIEDLQTEGLVVGAEPVKGGRGQPATPFSLAPRGAAAFGMQIDRHQARVVAIDLRGAVMATAETPLPEGGIEANMDRIMAAYGRVLDQLGDGPRRVGIGVAMPAPTGVHVARDDPWLGATQPEAHPLVQALGSQTGLPVSLHHDASAAAAAERLNGAARGIENFVHVFVGYGLGGGVFVRGELHAGHDRLAGELGLLPYGHGTLEEVASLAPLMRRLGLSPNAPDLYQALRTAHDEGATAPWLGEAAEGLAWLFGLLDCILNPDCIVLGGQMPDELLSALLERANRALDRRGTPDGLVRSTVLQGAADPFSVAVGAASHQIAAAFDPSLAAIGKTLGA